MALDLANNPATNAAGEVLTKKYGPLPLWGWLIIVTGTVYAVKKFQDNKQTAQAVDDANASTVGGSSLGGGGLVTPRASANDQSIYGGGSLTSATTGSSTVSSSAPQTNQEWLNRAIAFLGQRWDAFTVQQALNRFLNGLPVNDPTQQAIVREALNSSGSIGSLPQPISSSSPSSSDIVGFVRPAGKVGVFAKYSDGSLVWLGDGAATGAALRSAQQQGINTDIQDLPVNDPIWQYSDVVRNNNIRYLWEEQWAEYVAPNEYLSGRPDIITNPDALRRGQEAWNRSKAVLPDTWNGTGNVDAAVAAANLG